MPLLERFVKREKVVASRADIDEATRFLEQASRNVFSELKLDGSKEEKSAALGAVAQDMVRQWRSDRALYERYGGPVIFQQGNPLEPVGAYRRFLEDAERTGALEIYHPEDCKAFYDYFTRDHGHWIVPKDLIDYEKPWWARTDDQKSKRPPPAARRAERPNEQKQTQATK
jgi:hypothetical protein